CRGARYWQHPASETDQPLQAFRSFVSCASTAPRKDARRSMFAQRLERPVRLTTGLILFAFATSQLINHAFGIRSVNTMQAASAVLLAPWQTNTGLIVLYSAFLAHGLLCFYALYRRRHLHMPASEAWQLALGLTIPFLLISHAAGIRFGEFQYARELGYAPVLNKFWVVSPDFALPRQLLLLLVLWVHGCIGLRAWLRTKPAY